MEGRLPETVLKGGVAPPLTAAEQRHVAQRLSEVHADLALWRACERKACGRRRRCAGDVDECGALRSPRAWACLHEILAAIRAGTAPRRAARVATRRARPERQRVFGFGLLPGFTREKRADGSWRAVGEGQPPSQLTLQLRRLRAGSAHWLRAVGQGALVSRPSERKRAMSRDPGAT
jgi:hypothetical protein